MIKFKTKRSCAIINIKQIINKNTFRLEVSSNSGNFEWSCDSITKYPIKYIGIIPKLNIEWSFVRLGLKRIFAILEIQ